MASQKWKGWVTLHQGPGAPVAVSPNYEFESVDTVDGARAELLKIWEKAGRPSKATPAYDASLATTYANVVKVT